MEDKFDQKWEKEWENLWKPLLMSDGEFSEDKIKNEMHDLVFIFEQVGKVYMELTGGTLSKPMYYADQIIQLNEQRLNESYDQGHRDAVEEYKESVE